MSKRRKGRVGVEISTGDKGDNKKNAKNEDSETGKGRKRMTEREKKKTMIKIIEDNKIPPPKKGK